MLCYAIYLICQKLERGGSSSLSVLDHVHNAICSALAHAEIERERHVVGHTHRFVVQYVVQ